MENRLLSIKQHPVGVISEQPYNNKHKILANQIQTLIKKSLKIVWWLIFLCSVVYYYFPPNPSNLLFLFNYANNCNTDLKLIHALRHDFIYCTRYLGDLGFICDNYVRTTTKDFESTGFIGYLKGRSGMTPYGMLLDVEKRLLNYKIGFHKLFCRCWSFYSNQFMVLNFLKVVKLYSVSVLIPSVFFCIHLQYTMLIGKHTRSNQRTKSLFRSIACVSHIHCEF